MNADDLDRLARPSDPAPPWTDEQRATFVRILGPIARRRYAERLAAEAEEVKA